MYFDVYTSFLFLIIWLINDSIQLDCLQCTSLVQRSGDGWNHSCLDGTLVPLHCIDSNPQPNASYKMCISSMFRLVDHRKGVVLLHRGCSKLNITQQECDPPKISSDSTVAFYCSVGCLHDGCNRHLVKDIQSSSTSIFTDIVFNSIYSLVFYLTSLFLLLLYYE